MVRLRLLQRTSGALNQGRASPSLIRRGSGIRTPIFGFRDRRECLRDQDEGECCWVHEQGQLLLQTGNSPKPSTGFVRCLLMVCVLECWNTLSGKAAQNPAPRRLLLHHDGKRDNVSSIHQVRIPPTHRRQHRLQRKDPTHSSSPEHPSSRIRSNPDLRRAGDHRQEPSRIRDHRKTSQRTTLLEQGVVSGGRIEVDVLGMSQ